MDGSFFVTISSKEGRRPGGKAAALIWLVYLSFFFWEVVNLEYVTRLIAAGMHPDTASETALWFIGQGDDHGLEDYVQEVEARYQHGNAVRMGASDR